MGIDYVLDLDCAAKRALGTEGIVQLVKQRSRANAVLQMARERGDTRPPDQIAFTVVVQTPQGQQRSEVTVKQLFDSAAALDPHRAACAGCPANAGSQAGFGCYRSINYPIPARTEEWLLARLPDQLAGTLGGVMLANALRDFNWSGEHAAGMRAQGRSFFEASEPASVQWGRVHLDANQVFHMMFSVGPIQPSHAKMLALFFGVIPHDTPVEAMRDEKRAAEIVARATVPHQADPAIEAMADFLRTLAHGAALGATVLIDA